MDSSSATRTRNAVSEQEQAEALLGAIRHKLSGPEIRELERIIECDSFDEDFDDGTLTRLCTEFAEHLK